MLVLKKRESIFWEKDTTYTSNFKIDEIYVKKDEKDVFVERLRIVKYPKQDNVTVFHTVKTGSEEHSITGEICINVIDTEKQMTYEDARLKYLDEAFNIINIIQDIF